MTGPLCGPARVVHSHRRCFRSLTLRAWSASTGGGGQRPAPIPMDAAEKARRSMGYKNNWHRRQVDESQQVGCVRIWVCGWVAKAGV